MAIEIESLEERLSKITGYEYKKIIYDRLYAAVKAHIAHRERYLLEMSTLHDRRNVLDLGSDYVKNLLETVHDDTVRIDELTQIMRSLW